LPQWLGALRSISHDKTIADAYREMPQTEAEDTWTMANAIALTEAEPW
jgi:hypothetical protein